VSDRPSAAERVCDPEAVLTRSDLRDLGWERRGIDAIFRECLVILLPGYSRPVIRVADYLALLEGHSYCDRCGDRVRPRVGDHSPALEKRPDGAVGAASARTRPRPS